MQKRFNSIALPGDPIVEQEYQKTLPNHGITIRPDLIIHIPFERGATCRRNEGNFVAVEIKLNATPAGVDQDFASLVLMKERLAYPLTIFLNIGAARAYSERCPRTIAAQTLRFAVELGTTEPLIYQDGAPEPEVFDDRLERLLGFTHSHNVREMQILICRPPSSQCPDGP